MLRNKYHTMLIFCIDATCCHWSDASNHEAAITKQTDRNWDIWNFAIQYSIIQYLYTMSNEERMMRCTVIATVWTNFSSKLFSNVLNTNVITNTTQSLADKQKRFVLSTEMEPSRPNQISSGDQDWQQKWRANKPTKGWKQFVYWEQQPLETAAANWVEDKMKEEKSKIQTNVNPSGWQQSDKPSQI